MSGSKTRKPARKRKADTTPEQARQPVPAPEEPPAPEPPLDAQIRPRRVDEPPEPLGPVNEQDAPQGDSGAKPGPRDSHRKS